MKAAHPYEPPSTTSKSQSWSSIDYFVVGLWLAIPIIAFFGRQLLLPVFEDYGIELPAATQYLFHFYAPYFIAVPSVVLLLAMFIIPSGSTRRRFVRVACISGVLVAVICLLAFLVPLFSLAQNLMCRVEP